MLLGNLCCCFRVIFFHFLKSCLQVGITNVLRGLVRTRTFADVSRFLVCNAVCLSFHFLVCLVRVLCFHHDCHIEIVCFEPLPRTHTRVIKEYKPSAQERSDSNQTVRSSTSRALRCTSERSVSTVRALLGNQFALECNQDVVAE